jgi:hypothetical protein
MRKLSTLLLTLAAGSLTLAALADDEAPKPAEPGTLVIIDAGSKEQKVKSWKFTGGVRQLGWLASAAREDDNDKAKKGRPKAAPKGPEALVLYEELKTVYIPGVQTLVPLDRIRSIALESEKETMTVRVATGAKTEADASLVGTTRYKRVNTITVEADVDKGDEGIASLTFQSSGPRAFKGIRFPAPKVQAEKAGRAAVVIANHGKEKRTHKVSDLVPLYASRGRETTSPLLLFRKTLRIDVAKIRKIVASTEDSNDTVWQVVRKDGDDSTLTLLESGLINGQQARLVGLVGKVPAGYKLFPVLAINTILFDTSDDTEDLPSPKSEKDKSKEKDKEKPKDDR